MRRFTSEKKRQVTRVLDGKPTIWIGKGGVSQEILVEIEKQLQKKEVIKIRTLKSAITDLSTNEIAVSTAEKTGSKLIKVVGHTFLLYKPHEK